MYMYIKCVCVYVCVCVCVCVCVPHYVAMLIYPCNLAKRLVEIHSKSHGLPPAGGIYTAILATGQATS